jgi:hypothetical protein
VDSGVDVMIGGEGRPIDGSSLSSAGSELGMESDFDGDTEKT